MLKTYSTHSLFGFACWFEIQIYVTKNEQIFTLSICLTFLCPPGLGGQLRPAQVGWHAFMPGRPAHLMPGHPGLKASQPDLGGMRNIKHIDKVKIWPFSVL